MKVSIVVPVYKVEKYLSRCVDSIINQTYKNLEIILVDDESPDICPEICDKYALIDDRVKVIHKENGGLSSARNAGMEICKGDYIYFIDSDDWLSDNSVLEDFVNCAEKNDSDFCYGLLNKATDTEISQIYCNNRYSDDRLFFLSNPYLFSAWNKLYKRSLLQFIKFVPGRINEDVDVIPLVFSQAKKVCRLYKYTYNYYTNNESITRKKFSEKRFDMFKSVKHVYENFSGTSEELNVFYENIFGFQLFSVFIEILKNTSGTEKKMYLKKYVEMLKKNRFKGFFKYSLLCFLKNEKLSKQMKKIPALCLLWFYYLIY